MKHIILYICMLSVSSLWALEATPTIEDELKRIETLESDEIKTLGTYLEKGKITEAYREKYFKIYRKFYQKREQLFDQFCKEDDSCTDKVNYAIQNSDNNSA